MIEPFGVLMIMLHSSTIDSPMTGRSISYIARQLTLYIHSVGQNHLEPQIFPTQIAYSRIVVKSDLFW